MTELAVRSLPECESVIERGLATFVEVGEALLEIRDSRLYRESHGSFEDYCRERWRFNRQRASQLIGAAEVSSMLDSPPPNARVASELAPLRDDPDEMRGAWMEASANGEPTAARVREVVQERTRGQLANQSGGHDQWETPQDFFDLLDREFAFGLDVCALPSSAKCERYFSPDDDGLAQDWRGICWMNPPYGEAIGAWVRKAWASAQEGALVVCLVPARVDTGWWWDYCRHGEVRFLRGRLRFGGSGSGAPFPSAVVVFESGRPAAVKWWEWS